MPNYCLNIVDIGGDQAKIERLLQSIQGETEFDFNKIVPLPKKYSGDGPSDMQAKDVFINNQRKWFIKHWGMKWNAIHPEVDFWPSEGRMDGGIQKNRAILIFETAWNPSLPITVALSRMFPSLYFSHLYEESGVWFSGLMECKNGKVLYNERGDFGAYRCNNDEYYDDF